MAYDVIGDHSLPWFRDLAPVSRRQPSVIDTTREVGRTTGLLAEVVQALQ
jgi:hypothetical protein